jgi:hypothetical protein
VQIVLAQKDSSYLPLQVGNYWQFKSNDNTNPDYEKYMVTRDTIMSNGLKYYYMDEITNANLKNSVSKITKTQSYAWCFRGPLRDDIDGNVYSYDTISHNECLQYKFSGDAGYYESCIGTIRKYFGYNELTFESFGCIAIFYPGIGIYEYGCDFTYYSLTKAVNNNICVTCQTQVGVEKENSIPKTIKLYQNYPNPFNPETKINFDIPETGVVKLKVFTITGQEIITLIDEKKPAGSYSVIWNGKDKNNLKLSSGVYFYKLTFSNNNNQTTSMKKMIFTK